MTCPGVPWRGDRTGVVLPEHGIPGTATLPLANLHGDIVTNITLPATQGGTVSATSIGAWSDYTEYGTPRDPAATTAVGGSAGYGWLGAKERSTTTESAGLTLMGDRLYNAVTGRFTSLDPEPCVQPWRGSLDEAAYEE